MTARRAPNTLFPRAPPGLPAVSAAEMAELDRFLVEELGLPLLSMMENAGRHLAATVRALHPKARDVVVLAGPGGNGGGGLAAARHLANAGLEVRVHTTVGSQHLSPATRTQATVLERAGVPADVGPPAADAATELVVDALLGYGQRGAPRGAVGALVGWALAGEAPVISLDVPTGLGPDDGRSHAPCIAADATVTLALPKRGLLEPCARAHVGALLLADIGIPAAAYARLGVRPPPFVRGPVLAVERHG